MNEAVVCTYLTFTFSFNEDNYYLVVYSSRHDNTATYRVDRMDGVEVIDDDISEKAIALREEVSDMTTSSFKMFGGELVTVTLQFDDSLLDAVYDKFGEGIIIHRINERVVETSHPVQISPTFWGWLFQFGQQITIALLQGWHLLQSELLQRSAAGQRLRAGFLAVIS